MLLRFGFGVDDEQREREIEKKIFMSHTQPTLPRIQADQVKCDI